MGYGVIGNTADSGSAILGSSPGTPAGWNARKAIRSGILACVMLATRLAACGLYGLVLAPSSSGLGRRPLTAVAWVRIPSGLPNPSLGRRGWTGPRAGAEAPPGAGPRA